MAYSLISLELVQDEKDNDMLSGWIVTGSEYKEFELTKKGRITYVQILKKKEYESLTRFIGTMGKFNPYTKFFDPRQVDDLTFLLLLPLL